MNNSTEMTAILNELDIELKELIQADLENFRISRAIQP